MTGRVALRSAFAFSIFIGATLVGPFIDTKQQPWVGIFLGWACFASAMILLTDHEQRFRAQHKPVPEKGE